MNFFKLEQLMGQLGCEWYNIRDMIGYIGEALRRAGFNQPTFMSNLPHKLDQLMVLLDRKLELTETSRAWIQHSLIETGWVDVNPIQINSLKNLAYLAVAQSHNFDQLKLMISSHQDDYQECETFLIQRNKMIKNLIKHASYLMGHPFGGFCRDTLKGGLERHHDGRVANDLDLMFDDSSSITRFIQSIKLLNKYIVTCVKSTHQYILGGYHESYHVHLKNDTTVQIKMDCVYKLVTFPEPHKTDCCIDFNVNALVGDWHGDQLYYGVRCDLQRIPGLSLSEIAVDIEHKQFRAIGIVLNTTYDTEKVFSDPTAHVCAHRASIQGRTMRRRANSLIARGWKLLTTCDHPTCWLGSEELYQQHLARDQLIQQRQLEQHQRMIEQQKQDMIEQQKQDMIREAIATAPDEPLDNLKMRGQRRRKLQEKYHH